MLAERQKLPLLAQIPLIQSVRESGDAGRPVSAKTDAASEYYDLLANNIVRELPLIRPLMIIFRLFICIRLFSNTMNAFQNVNNLLNRPA